MRGAEAGEELRAFAQNFSSLIAASLVKPPNHFENICAGRAILFRRVPTSSRLHVWVECCQYSRRRVTLTVTGLWSLSRGSRSIQWPKSPKDVIFAFRRYE
jgi:hypothetical protein